MKLKSLINDKKLSIDNINIVGLSENSKEIKKNYIFFIKETKNFKSSYIDEAVNNGAKLIIYSKDCQLNIKKYNNLCYFYAVDDIDRAISKLSEKFHKVKKNKIKIYGITGTNGKSTVSNFIAQLITLQKEKAGLIGTLGNGIYPKLSQKNLTTPNIIDINKYISQFFNKEASAVVIEASSHGIKQNRIQGINFDTVIFTNLTHDHLDYHKNMKDYYNTKLKLFTKYKSKRKIICIDNYYGKKIYKDIKNRNKVKTVSISNSKADFYASDITYYRYGIKFKIHSNYGDKEINIKMFGEFNVINILLAVASLATNKIKYNLIINNIIKLKPIDGRMNKYYKVGYPTTFIDFAHTPDAMKQVIVSIKKHFPKNKIITIFGCGGERDTKKRKSMGEIACKLSDHIIITNDNPRNESQKKITEDIILGIKKNKKYQVVLDRSKAIKKSLNRGNFNKVVLILGKGHEQFQIVKSKKIAYSDKSEVIKLMV